MRTGHKKRDITALRGGLKRTARACARRCQTPLGDTSKAARFGAAGIYLHVLDALAEAVLAAREIEKEFSRVWSFVEPNYWHEPLYQSGFLQDLKEDRRDMISGLLEDLVELGIAKNLPRLEDALIYLTLLAECFPAELVGITGGPPRRHLAFWIAVAEGRRTLRRARRAKASPNSCNDFRFMEAGRVTPSTMRWLTWR